MCPLVGSPNRGYADYQRVGNWDTGVIWHLPATSFPAQVQSPMMDVSRQGYIIGQLGLNSGMCEVIWDWYNDQFGITLLCERRYTMTSLVGPYQQLHLVAAGPYCQVTLNALGGANADAFASMVASNRVHPLEFIPANALLINNQVFSVVVGDNPHYPADYYSGPVAVSLLNGSAAQTIYTQTLNTAGVWDYSDVHAVTGANFAFESLVPVGAWRMVINSTAAVNGLRFTVIPTTTGAT